MSAVIIYMSRHGCAEKAAFMLRDMYWKNVTLVNLGKSLPPALDGYDTVIIGGSVHMGQIQGKIRKFCIENEAILLEKRLGLYLCHMREGEDAVRQFNEAFSGNLRKHAVARALFGGEFTLEKMNKVERSLVENAGVPESISRLNADAIENFGKVIFHLDKS